MISIRNSRFIRFEDNVSAILAELDVDVHKELPENGELNGQKLAHGSIAHVLTTGDFYCLGGDNGWYNQDGSNAGDYPIQGE